MKRTAFLLAAAWLVARPGVTAKGADSFGYQWFDSHEAECPYGDITFDVIDDVILQDDEVVGPYDIGFPFPLYGQFYDQLWISSNGFLTLGATAPPPAPSPSRLPRVLAPNAVVAPFWADFDRGAAVYGHHISNGYYYVRWQRALAGRTYLLVFETRLYPSGRIEHIYGAEFWWMPAPDRSLLVSGIENAAGDRGIMTWNRGTGLDGYAFRPEHQLCFVPPPSLGCTLGTIGCGMTRSSNTSTRASTSSGYSCDTLAADGGEAAYNFTLTNLTEVSARLGGIGARDVRLYLLRGCDENSCIEGGAEAVDSRLLGPGTYSLVADQALAEAGPVDISMDCLQRGFSHPCGTSQVGDIGVGESLIASYPCEPDAVYPGPETFYDLSHPGGNLRLKLTAGCDLDAFVFAAGDLDPSSCLAHGRGGVTLYQAPPGDYVVVVEGRNGVSCSFTTDLTCGIDLTCNPLAGILGCGDVASGSTIGAADTASDYSCRPSELYDGGEAVYLITGTFGKSLGAVLENASSPDLEVVLVERCDEGSCVDTAGASMACDNDVDSVSRYAVVDGRNGASGTFDLRVECGPPMLPGDWRVCEVPFEPLELETRASDAWHFSTPLPTPVDPNPMPMSSYCGSACDFALYLPIDCPQAFHLAFDDAESAAGVELTEVFTNRRLLLQADNDGGKFGTDPWSYAGFTANWLSSPCAFPAPSPRDPPDLGRNDPRFNDAIVDVMVDPVEDPCGLWRIDLRSMGGVNWDLYANCSGEARPGFVLYDNVCDAQAAYAPRAELHISNLQTDGNCPLAEVTFDLENLGCSAIDAPWRIDGGPGSIVDGTIMLPPGELRTITQSVDVTSAAGRVTVLADADGVVAECSEVLGALCSVTGIHELELQACTGCVVPSPPIGVIGNAVRAVKAGPGAGLSWLTAPSLSAARASHYHVYRSDLASAGAWLNLPSPDTLSAAELIDATPPDPLNFYQVRFSNDCEEISGGLLP